MLGYLHGYHAGNPADVLKHSALLFCLAYLKQKKKPFLCVDTQAGSGIYGLDENSHNREWEHGVGRLLVPAADRAGMPSLIGEYLKFQGGYLSARQYAGSSEIMARLLEKGDRLVSFELHPREFVSLEAAMYREVPGKGPSIQVRREDGPAGLKALLPPVSRRGLIFIDPSWEERDEYETVPRYLGEGLRRFPGGTFIVWYPLLAVQKGKASFSLPDALFGLANLPRCRIALLAEDGPGMRSPRGMYGSGLVIYNPPWTLKAALEEAMPFLALALGGAEGGWRFDWTD